MLQNQYSMIRADLLMGVGISATQSLETKTLSKVNNLFPLPDKALVQV